MIHKFMGELKDQKPCEPVLFFILESYTIIKKLIQYTVLKDDCH